MKKMQILSLILLAAVFLFCVTALSQEGNPGINGLKIEKSVFCTEVKDREPVGESTVFPADVGRVYLWTSVVGSGNPSKIKHVWYYGVKKMREITLDVEYERTRTWSYKNILPQWAGDWHVEILDENDNVLESLSFSVTEPSNE